MIMTVLDAQHVTLGFIGLGNMGSRIAQRLLAHGYKLVVFDRNRTKAEALVPKGAVPVNDVL
jgi:3-hydroxyisobutyrate dehydrogenase-like beta-hydroxyacid dehydrogenase